MVEKAGKSPEANIKPKEAPALSQKAQKRISELEARIKNLEELKSNLDNPTSQEDIDNRIRQARFAIFMAKKQPDTVNDASPNKITPNIKKSLERGLAKLTKVVTSNKTEYPKQFDRRLQQNRKQVLEFAKQAGINANLLSTNKKEFVRQLQNALGVKADGAFGKNTESALAASIGSNEANTNIQKSLENQLAALQTAKAKLIEDRKYIKERINTYNQILNDNEAKHGFSQKEFRGDVYTKIQELTDKEDELVDAIWDIDKQIASLDK